MNPHSGTVHRPGAKPQYGSSQRQPTTVPAEGTEGCEVGAQLWALLHLGRALAVRQNPDGAYRGRRDPVSIEEVEQHLRGAVTLAFTVLAQKRALFASLDIDAAFEAVVPVIRTHLLRIGGEDLLRASFLTNGSSRGRGKLIVCFQEPMRRIDAYGIMFDVFRCIKQSPEGQSIPSACLTMFPQKGSGGIVRVLGRHCTRAGDIERPYTLELEECDLSAVRPLSKQALRTIAQSLQTPQPTWLAKQLTQPWTRVDGTTTHYRRMIAIARIALERYGKQRGWAKFGQWLDQIEANSPDLRLPSLSTKDGRNTLRRSRARAWQHAVREPQSWYPQDTAWCSSAGAVAVYLHLVAFVKDQQLRPHSFALDYENIAGAMDSSKSTAYRRVQQAERLGLLVRRDRGCPDRPGERGAATRYALVGQGETPFNALGLKRAIHELPRGTPR